MPSSSASGTPDPDRRETRESPSTARLRARHAREVRELFDELRARDPVWAARLAEEDQINDDDDDEAGGSESGDGVAPAPGAAATAAAPTRADDDGAQPAWRGGGAGGDDCRGGDDRRGSDDRRGGDAGTATARAHPLEVVVTRTTRAIVQSSMRASVSLWGERERVCRERRAIASRARPKRI